ncbi:MAG: DUF6361 family protein, partial [Bacteroidota bacterium]
AVRDALAELLFPGTSTIQTRARYFLFVPWIYLKLEAKIERSQVPPNEVADRARREEVALIDALAESDDTNGVIGIQARASLKRLPSNVYWQGLGRWRIRLFPGSQEQYHRSLNGFYDRMRRIARDDEGTPLGGPMRPNWHPGLPPAPPGFPRKASFQLAKAEADYVRSRIMTQVPGTLLALLVDGVGPPTQVVFPWEHPQVQDFPARIKEQLDHARNFSEAIHGAALLYNLMLAELSGQEELMEEYRARLSEWSTLIAERREPLANWDRRRFWSIVISSGARVAPATRLFIDTWLDLTLSGDRVRGGPVRDISRVADSERARSLIRDRETLLKRDQARLTNRRALELWNGAAGTAQLSYRWPVAQTIVADILAGLRRRDEGA